VTDAIEIDGRSLTLEQVERVARRPGTSVRLSGAARSAIERSAEYVESLIASGERIYGVSTGFGRLAEVVVSPEDQKKLQRNLIRSHCAGVGRRLDRPEVRAIMLLRANALARGNSGCRLVVVERLLEYLEAGIHPVVPESGSVGASGDLAPLAHVALALIGEGEVEVGGELRPTPEVLRERGMTSIELREKEGLALINGTQATTGFAVLALLAAERAVETAEVAGAMSLEALRGTPEAFRPEVHEVRPHPGQITSARRLTHLLRDSEIRESHRVGDSRIQDAYALRCMPQVHGATRETLSYVRRILETEANSATDNPLIFPEEAAVVSAGNFHAQIVSQALDYLGIAVADLAAISERRTERLLNPDLSGLPAFLAQEPGLQSGFMIAQVTAVDLLSEMRILAHPASVDTVPTSANQEDHVSMGMAAGRKARRAIECLEYILGIELLCATQALDFLEPLRPGLGVIEACDRMRERIAPLEEDRVLAGDMEVARELVRDGAFARIALDG
jgi:histidine ammonia-lyase